MANYKKMYFDLVAQVDKVVNLLIAAQNKAEAEYCKGNNQSKKSINEKKKQFESYLFANYILKYPQYLLRAFFIEFYSQN